MSMVNPESPRINAGHHVTSSPAGHSGEKKPAESLAHTVKERAFRTPEQAKSLLNRASQVAPEKTVSAVNKLIKRLSA